MQHYFDESTNTFTLLNINPEIEWDPFDDTYCSTKLNNIKIKVFELWLNGNNVNAWSNNVDKIVWEFDNCPSKDEYNNFVRDLYCVMNRLNLNKSQ
jgi:hypothetical protein